MSSKFLSDKSALALSLPMNKFEGRKWSTEGTPAKMLKFLRRFIANGFADGRLNGCDAFADDNGDFDTIRAAFHELPLLEREALLQQVPFGKSIAEIASRLRLSEVEVRTLLVRARRNLRLSCGEDVSMDSPAMTDRPFCVSE